MTYQELKKLDDEELLKLTSFGDNDNFFFYSDLLRIEKINDTEEYRFLLKDETSIYTNSMKTLKNVRLGKGIYDLIAKSLDNQEEEIKRNEDFRNNITKILLDKINEINKISLESKKASKDILNETHKYMKKEMKNISLDLEYSKNTWNDKLKELDSFNANDYSVGMKKIDKIIDIFSEFLK